MILHIAFLIFDMLCFSTLRSGIFFACSQDIAFLELATIPSSKWPNWRFFDLGKRSIRRKSTTPSLTHTVSDSLSRKWMDGGYTPWKMKECPPKKVQFLKENFHLSTLNFSGGSVSFQVCNFQRNDLFPRRGREGLLNFSI